MFAVLFSVKINKILQGLHEPNIRKNNQRSQKIKIKVHSTDNLKASRVDSRHSS